jgi:hypothetical protein
LSRSIPHSQLNRDMKTTGDKRENTPLSSCTKTAWFPCAIMLAICVAYAIGCTPIPEFTCWNNTGGTVEINSDGNLHGVPNGSSQTIRFPGNTMRLYIRNVSGTVWRYDVKYPSRTFIVGQKTMYFQIQPDGSIYVLTPPAKGIVTNFPAQPAGFPLRPQE